MRRYCRLNNFKHAGRWDHVPEHTCTSCIRLRQVCRVPHLLHIQAEQTVSQFLCLSCLLSLITHQQMAPRLKSHHLPTDTEWKWETQEPTVVFRQSLMSRNLNIQWLSDGVALVSGAAYNSLLVFGRNLLLQVSRDDLYQRSQNYHRAADYEIDLVIQDKRTDKFDKVYNLFDFVCPLQRQREYTLNWSFLFHPWPSFHSIIPVPVHANNNPHRLWYFVQSLKHSTHTYRR